MNRIGVDLIGEVSLLKENGRHLPIFRESWGNTPRIGTSSEDSYFLYLLDNEKLQPGEHSKAEFKYKFSDDDRFYPGFKKLEVGQVLELKEASRKIGDFVITEIANKKLE